MIWGVYITFPWIQDDFAKSVKIIVTWQRWSCVLLKAVSWKARQSLPHLVELSCLDLSHPVRSPTSLRLPCWLNHMEVLWAMVHMCSCQSVSTACYMSQVLGTPSPIAPPNPCSLSQPLTTVAWETSKPEQLGTTQPESWSIKLWVNQMLF
jgi:hypothetical protein